MEIKEILQITSVATVISVSATFLTQKFILQKSRKYQDIELVGKLFGQLGGSLHAMRENYYNLMTSFLLHSFYSELLEKIQKGNIQRNHQYIDSCRQTIKDLWTSYDKDFHSTRKLNNECLSALFNIAFIIKSDELNAIMERIKNYKIPISEFHKLSLEQMQKEGWISEHIFPLVDKNIESMDEDIKKINAIIFNYGK